MKKFYRTHINKLLITVVCLIVCFTLTAQAIRSSIDKNTILIGERITYTLTVGLPSPEYTVSINIPDSIPHFEILEKNGGNGKDKDGNIVWQQKIVFTSFDSGSYNFPGLLYRINHLNTASQTLSTNEIKIEVGYMPLDKGGMPRDIKSILNVEYIDWFWVYIAAGILLLLLTLFFVWRYFRKKKKVVAPINAKGAYEEALFALDELRKANEQRLLGVKEYHTKLADILRSYYGKTVNQNFSNKTTQEILLKLKSHELKAETASHATEALATGDAVKFAKYNSSYTENEAALNYLKTVIEEIELSRTKKFKICVSIIFQTLNFLSRIFLRCCYSFHY